MKRAWHQQAKRSPPEERTLDGIVFDSRAEMKRWAELQLLQKAGEIYLLDRQVQLNLVINGKPVKIRSRGVPNGRACHYTADFIYFEKGTDKRVIEEYKSFDDPTSRLRRAVVEAIYGIEIRVTGAAAKHTPGKSA